MLDTAISERAAHLVDPRNVETLDVLGPVVQFLTAPRDGEPCVMRGTIPPGVTVPLHSHADPETFIQIPARSKGFRSRRKASSGYRSGRATFSMCRAGRSTPFETCRLRRP